MLSVSCASTCERVGEGGLSFRYLKHEPIVTWQYSTSRVRGRKYFDERDDLRFGRYWGSEFEYLFHLAEAARKKRSHLYGPRPYALRVLGATAVLKHLERNDFHTERTRPLVYARFYSCLRRSWGRH